MKACGLIVEYNPFHNGHLYHVNKAKEMSKAQCVIAVMSGSFLQRGEPAIIDKFHRTRAALQSGIDIVIELPYPYAVQSSELFAKGAIFSLQNIGVSSICFGSESGDVAHFKNSVAILHEKKDSFNDFVRVFIDKGYSYPKASSKAYEEVGIDQIDLFQPNNILGFSYMNTIIENKLPINAFTIKRIRNEYHDENISNKIASATSIRKEVMNYGISKKINETLPASSLAAFKQYKRQTNVWHNWEHYFPYLHYRVMTMTNSDLATIQGVDEGLEHRIKRTATEASSFYDWLERLKTKRYTYVRLQRTFVHILTNTRKTEIEQFTTSKGVPYIRLLGMNDNGRAYLNRQKKDIQTPIVTNLNRDNSLMLALDEKATNAYYSILLPKQRITLRKQEFQLPILMPY